MGLEEYAGEFAALGYGVVVFDYRRWGTSGKPHARLSVQPSILGQSMLSLVQFADGTPRHVVYVSEQLEDYRTVVKFCRQQPEFDPQRVILWGSSFAGKFHGDHVTASARSADTPVPYRRSCGDASK